MITIDFSNPAQMVVISVAIMLVIGVSFIGGSIVEDGTKTGVVDHIPLIPIIGFFLGCGSLIYHLITLITQHL